MKWVLASLMLLALAASAYLDLSVWRECRTDHSWLYCVRVLGK